MPVEVTYDYVIVRVMPRVERGEQINVGVILSCVDSEVLEARMELDEARLLSIDPAIDLDVVRAALATIPLICAGGARGGEIGDLPARARFRWLASPRSTMIQTSPVHTGRSTDPQATLARLFDALVRHEPATE